MYDGQVIICKDIIEDNWLEYLTYVKERHNKELEQQNKRMEALKEWEAGHGRVGDVGCEKMESPLSDNRYYDLSINGFWNWYVTYRVETK